MDHAKMKQGLRYRITFLLLVLMIFMAAVLSIVSYFAFAKTYLRFYDEKAQQMVRTVAERTDWEQIEAYAETGEADDYVKDLQNFYDNMKISAQSPLYLYLFVPGPDSFTYLYEARTPDDDMRYIASWGDVFPYRDFEYNYIVPDIEAKKAHDQITYQSSEEYGDGLSTWAPVLDRDGNVRAMVELDYLLPSFRRDLNSFVLGIVSIFVIFIIGILIIMLIYLNKIVLRPIALLDRSVDTYEHGQLALPERLFRKDDEIKHLSVSFTGMVERIEQYTAQIASVTAERERINAELNVAKKIQADMLPRTFPAFPDRTDCDIYATMDPAKEVGGDFYDFFFIDRSHIALVMADVSGKGIPAALFMVISKTLIKNRVLLGGSPAQILKDVNEQICEGNDENLFVTVWLAIIDLETGRGMAANAGHEHPVLCRKGRNFKLVVYRHSPALGMMPGISFLEHEVCLEPGDRVFVYTDGVVEANNKAYELFGTDRMLDALNRDPAGPLVKVLRNVREAVDTFAGEEPQFDDLSMMIFDYKGVL